MNMSLVAQQLLVVKSIPLFVVCRIGNNFCVFDLISKKQCFKTVAALHSGLCLCGFVIR